MPGRVQRHRGPAQGERFAMAMHVVVLLAQPPLQDRQAGIDDVVAAHAAARMVAMPVGDHRARYRLPGVDVEIPVRAVQAFGALDNQLAAHHRLLLYTSPDPTQPGRSPG